MGDTKEYPVVYLISPIMSTGDYEENVEAAREAALILWELGHAVHCPALNTHGMAGKLPEEVFVTGELAIARKCDLYAVVGRWENSKNCLDEVVEMSLAGKKEIPGGTQIELSTRMRRLKLFKAVT